MYMTQKEYIQNNGTTCPNVECNDPDPDGSVEWLDFPEWGKDKTVVAGLRCLHCKTQWEEQYTFKRYNLIGDTK